MGNRSSHSLDKAAFLFPTREEQDQQEQEQQGEGGEPDLIADSMGGSTNGSSRSSITGSLADSVDLLALHHPYNDDNDKETVKCVDFFSFFTRRQESFLMVNTDHDHVSDDVDDDDAAPGNGLLSSSSTSSSPCTPQYWASSSSSSTSSSWGESCKGHADYNNDEHYDSSLDDTNIGNHSARQRRVNSWNSFSFARSETLEYTDEELELQNGSQATVISNLRHHRRPVWIVTTAALPWMTGTAVNPLLRAAYLSQRYRQEQQAELENDMDNNDMDDNKTPVVTSLVTLVIPWLESADDRVALYGRSWQDSTQQEQDAYIRNWLAESAGLTKEADPVTGLQIQFYPARYHAGLSSIFAMGDFCERLVVPEDSINNAVCILEEPEHLNYYSTSTCRVG
jgi:hypothetical protein